MSVVTPPDRLVDALTRAADTLQGDLWESLVHWIPSIVRRLKTDDAAYARMFELLFDQPSARGESELPRLLAHARGLTADLRNWCQRETQRDKEIFVGEVGMDLIAGQTRFVTQSLFDILSGRDL